MHPFSRPAQDTRRYLAQNIQSLSSNRVYVGKALPYFFTSTALPLAYVFDIPIYYSVLSLLDSRRVSNAT